MSDICTVVMTGRLTRDVELKYTQSGTAIANFSIANGRKMKSGNEWKDVTSFFDVTIMGKTAEGLKPYLTKGKMIAVSGNMRQDRWTDKEGHTKSKVYVFADEIELIGGGSSTSEQRKQNVQSVQNEPVFENSENDFPEDIPF